MVLQIDVLDAWKIFTENPNSILVDVRTKEEVEFVGFVDLSKTNAKTIYLPWKVYPSMVVDEAFTDKLSALIAEEFPSSSNETNLLFICRSGNRSFEAAMYMSDLGYKCYNIKDGFEGTHNELGQRGKTNGWKAQNLPWRQN